MSAIEAIPLDDAGRPLFELPDELAIDTDVARRVISGFIRGQLAQAGFERLVLGLSGGIDSGLVAYLVAEAIGADKLLCVLMPYRTSSPASRGDAETIVADLGCTSELVEITAMVDAYFGRDAEVGAGGEACAMRRRSGAATSWPGCACPCCTTGPWRSAGSSSAPATRPSR